MEAAAQIGRWDGAVLFLCRRTRLREAVEASKQASKQARKEGKEEDETGEEGKEEDETGEGDSGRLTETQERP